MSQYTAHLDIDGDEDVTVTVYYTAHRFIAGRTDGRGGPKLESDEPAHIEIESVVLPDGRIYELTATLVAQLEEEISEWLDGMRDTPEPDGDE